MSLLGYMFIADALSKSRNGGSDNASLGMIKCASGEDKLDKHKKFMASLSDEEREEYLKNAKAKVLLRKLGEEKYIEHLERSVMDKIVDDAIDEMGADRFNDFLLLKSKDKRIAELEEENKKLKEEKRPKRYIRKK